MSDEKPAWIAKALAECGKNKPQFIILSPRAAAWLGYPRRPQ
jgi:hypothetical protein